MGPPLLPVQLWLSQVDTVESPGAWVEIFHYYGGLGTNKFESSLVWLYRARGSGVWYHTGRILAFSDTADLRHYMSSRFNQTVRSKARLIERARQLLGGTYSTIAFTHHVDAGFTNQRVCSDPMRGWSSVYYYVSELVVLGSEVQGVRSCPPLPGLRWGMAPNKLQPKARA